MRLEAEQLSFRYPGGSWVLKDVSFHVESGERVGLVGPSGYGKSTLAKLLSGYLEPTEGRILLDGKPLPTKGFHPIQLVHQHPEEALNTRLRLRDSLFEAWQPGGAFLAAMGIEEGWLDRFPTELSGGELQRFCVARALGPKTAFLLADEMSAMLDVITQAQIWALTLEQAAERGLGLIAVTHNAALAEKICTRMLYLEEQNRV